MLEDRQIEQSRAIQQNTGRTFYFATRFLPERVRHPTYVLYAFFRKADEVVDDERASERPAEEQAAALEELRAQALGEAEPDGPVLEAFQAVKTEYDIPDEEINVFIDAMKTDIHTSRYDTFEDLREYMRGSAAAVGVMMTAIMEPADREEAIPHARALGEAFQMSNFLRDVREDIVDRDRIYLPQSTLSTHGVTDDQIAALEFDENFAAAMRMELERTEQLYREGVLGIESLPEDCQFPVLLAAVLYADYHRQIRNQSYDVLTTEPSLSTLRKISLFARTRLRWQFTRDPSTVFSSVSDVSVTDSDSRPLESFDTTPVQ
jgi:phytoene synthase